MLIIEFPNLEINADCEINGRSSYQIDNFFLISNKSIIYCFLKIDCFRKAKEGKIHILYAERKFNKKMITNGANILCIC